MMNSIDSVLKKAAIASAVSMAITGGAQAAFTPLPVNTSFRVTVTGGCFDFQNCVGNAARAFVDNTADEATITITAAAAIGFSPPPGTYGSGIAGDGLMGIIDIVTDSSGAGFSVTSYSQDSYLATAGGTFFLDVELSTVAKMKGTLDGSGKMTLDPRGRFGMAAGFITALGHQEWNRDNTLNGLGNNLYGQFTTATSTNRSKGQTPGFTLTGTALQDTGAGVWAGTLVQAGNIGREWGGFNNTLYSEQLDIVITQLLNPVAVDDNPETARDSAVSIDVLANDNDSQGGALTIASVATSVQTYGTAVINAGKILYTPTAGFVGDGIFTYKVSSAGGTSNNSATVTVNVSEIGNISPVANDDTLVTDEHVAGTTVDVTLNDTDDDGDTLTVISNTAAVNGVVVDNGDNTFTYTPNGHFNGDDSSEYDDNFEYTIEDGKGGKATAKVNITVNPINDPPVANVDTVTTKPDTPVDIDVLGNDTDPDVDDILSVQSFTQPANGVVAANTNGTLKYTPDAGFLSSDQFTYIVADGNGGTDTGTVNITVIAASHVSPVGPNDPKNQVNPDVSGGSNFTMINPSGSDIGGTNDLGATWDGSVYISESQTDANMSIFTDTPTPFFGFVWDATTVRVFGPGSYTFQTCEGTLVNSGGVLGWIAPDGSTNCNAPPEPNIVTMTVGPKQLGAHMLFNWNVTKNIDVVMVWDINQVWTGSPDGSNNFNAVGSVFNLVVIDDDGDGINGHPMADGPFKNFNADFNLNLDPPFSLPAATASSTQGGSNTSVVIPGQGNVTVTASTDSGNASYDWSASDAALVAAAVGGLRSATLVFDPSGLPNGAVTARVTIITDDREGRLQNDTEVALTVDSSQILADAADDTGNGIPNAQDLGDPTRLQGEAGNNALYLLQTSAGQLKLGSMAAANGAQGNGYAAGVTTTEIGAVDPAVSDSCVGGCYDFEVVGITPGSSVSVVLPQTNPLPSDALYRLFVNGQWRDFRATGTAGGTAGGSIASAPGGPGTCPAPNDSAYTPGLGEGDYCVQLTLVDGGRNDADGAENGRIVDPSGVGGGVVTQSAAKSTISSPGTSGGCSLGATPVDPLERADWWLMAGVIGLFGWLSGSRKRRKAE